MLQMFTAAYSQGFKDHFFHSIGYTGHPRLHATTFIIGSDRGEQRSANAVQLYHYYLCLQARINIIDLDDNTSIDIHAIPALGISYGATNDLDQVYLGSFNLP
jgi:hypothetical protein